MNTPKSHDGMVAELVRRGLPPEYARRMAAELGDHERDLVDELRATGVGESELLAEASHRLGDRRTLVKKTVREYQRRYWCGRWPLLTFLIGPVTTLFVVWLATVLSLTCFAWTADSVGFNFGSADGRTSVAEFVFIELLWCLVFAFPPTLVAALFPWLARRIGYGLVWGAIAGLEMALTAGLIRFNVDYQRCYLDMRWPVDIPMVSNWVDWYFGGSWRHLLQFALPLAICAATLAIHRFAKYREARMTAS